MRWEHSILFLLASLAIGSLSGCHRNLRHFGPPPPAYACDGYGCDGYGAYGGYAECVDDGQYYSRRDRRRMSRYDRRIGRHGPTLDGLPVVAAYIVPMEMMGNCECACGGWDPCQCGCEIAPSCEPCSPCGCGVDSYMNDMEWHGTPSEAYPSSYMEQPYDQYGGESISPVPAPPAQEGPWNPPGISPTAPHTTPEPQASRPVESATWLPAQLP